MGVGKSTLGKAVARIGCLDFLDLDRQIETIASCSIPEIFAKCGEEGFRAMESDELGHIEPNRNMVVSCGGGIVTRPSNRTLLKELGFVVWLKADEEAIFERVSRNRQRPLLQTENPRATIQALLAAREPLYREVADFELDTTRQTHEESAREVLRQLTHWRHHSCRSAVVQDL